MSQYPNLFKKIEIENEFRRITGVGQLFTTVDKWLKQNCTNVIEFINAKKTLPKETEALKETLLSFRHVSSIIGEEVKDLATAGVLLPCLLQEKHSLFFEIVQVNTCF